MPRYLAVWNRQRETETDEKRKALNDRLVVVEKKERRQSKIRTPFSPRGIYSGSKNMKKKKKKKLVCAPERNSYYPSL